MGHILAALMPTFLSTPSARRATSGRVESHGFQLHFYPRPPRGGRLGLQGIWRDEIISIHALREEGDSTPS